MNNKDLKAFLINVRDNGQLTEAFDMADFLKKNGYISGEYVGTPPDQFDTYMSMRWYLGQGISIVESQAWFAMNSWLNCIEKFVPDNIEITYLPDNLFTIE